MARLQQFAGGAFGAGGTIAIRETLGGPDYTRWRQPSVLFGLGTGALATGLWYTNKSGRFETPVLGEDFWGAHALTSVPAGLLYAALPAEPGSTTVEQIAERLGLGDLLGDGSNGGQTGGGNGGGSSGAENVTVRRANAGRTSNGAMQRRR
mgnify:CR=1 FL=1